MPGDWECHPRPSQHSSAFHRPNTYLLHHPSTVVVTPSSSLSLPILPLLPLSTTQLTPFPTLPLSLLNQLEFLRYSVLFLLLFFYYSCFSSTVLFFTSLFSSLLVNIFLLVLLFIYYSLLVPHALSVSYSLVISNLVVVGIYSNSLLLMHPVLVVYGTIVEPSVHIAGGLPTTAQLLVQLPDKPPLQIDRRCHSQEHGRNGSPRFGNGTAPVYAASMFDLLWWDVLGGR